MLKELRPAVVSLALLTLLTGVLGEPRVSVLRLNRALDQMAK